MRHTNIVMKTRERTVFAEVHESEVIYSRSASREPIIPVIYIKIRWDVDEPAKNVGTEYGCFRR